jgi:plastocyanin
MNKIFLSIIFIVMILSGCVSPAPTPIAITTPIVVTTPTHTPIVTETPIVESKQIINVSKESYISQVDELYGFRRMIKTSGIPDYKNNVLTINSGDNVKWISNTDAGYYLTIVSSEGLWNNSSSQMRYALRSFNYTFDQSGKYEVYLKEFPRIAHQIIVVN